MPRYIDADKLLRDTIYNPNHVPYIAESDIIFAPKADAVEVVRCKKCKFWGESLTKEERKECDVYADLVCTYWMSDGLTRDDFCSKGERREDE